MDALKELGKLLEETCNINWLDAMEYEGDPAFWEIDDDDWHEVMGNIEKTPENIVEFYRKNPEELQAIKDMIDEDYELRTWNVNAWRNS